MDASNPMADGPIAPDVPSTLIQVLPCALGVMAGAAAWDGLKKGVSWAGRNFAAEETGRSR